MDNLVQEHKFRRQHAQVVLNYFQPLASSPRPDLGLTEVELKIVSSLLAKGEASRSSCAQLEKIVAALEAQKDAKLAELKEWFGNAHTNLHQAEEDLMAEIKTKFTQAHTILQQHLETARQAQTQIAESEARCLSLPAKTLSEIKQRTEQIASLVDAALNVGIPSIEGNVNLSLEFASAVEAFFTGDGSRPALAHVKLPLPRIRVSGFASAEHTTATGSGLERFRVNQENKFVIVAKDSDGQPRDTGGDVFVVESKEVELKATIVDQKNGTYQVSYLVGETMDRKLALVVSLRGRAINGSPFDVRMMSVLGRMACGDSHTMVLKTDGTLWGFGHNSDGRLGDGTTTARHSPVQISAFAALSVAQVACGGYHTMVLKADGVCQMFGRNNYGQLGDGTTTD